ncbi:MAG: hypothetical protein CSB48_11630 [Proteobacteria bacterium]|nr:MAG: hypothetical protein CSB48_11630 [Pseudomonadota bacterium]PIE40123.1 MAG: hypothetical protein CSA51_02485 [Gammaproteobacteria bacterium]
MSSILFHLSICRITTFCLRRLLLCLCLLSLPVLSAEKPAFEFELDIEAKTIGDIRPALISFSAGSQPKVPVREVMRRYRLLFETSDNPKIRVESLWRWNELEHIFGSDEEMSEAEEVRLYQRAIESYEQLLAENNPDYPVDALLYQAAKAYDIIGKREKSIRLLEQMARRYPRSRYATEAWFRVAEHHFSSGDYLAAEKAYQKSMARGREKRFYDKSLYMLGWSRFKQSRYNDSLINFLEVLDIAYSKDQSLKNLEQGLQSTIDDTLRIISIVFSYSNEQDPVAALMRSSGERQYVDQLYRSLSQFYFDRERYQDSVNVNRNYIKLYPDSAAAPIMAYRNIEIYKYADFVTDLWKEKRAFIDQYGARKDILACSEPYIREEFVKDVKQVLGDLSHYDYVRAQKISNAALRSKTFLSAAKYYGTRADLFPKDEKAGVNRFMSGEANYRAGQYERASAEYRKSAYDYPPHEKSAEAGYSALISFKKAHRAELNEVNGASSVKLDYIQLARLFAQSYPADKRAKPVTLVALNELLKLERYTDVAQITGRMISENRFASDRAMTRKIWQAQSAAYFNSGDYPKSEKSFEKLLGFDGLDASERKQARENYAVSMYRNGEASIKAGDWRSGVDRWVRIGKILPDTQVSRNAGYDAASELLGHERWQEAIPILVEFRQDYPDDPLTRNIPDKLVTAYLESGNTLFAADEYEQLAKRLEGQEKGRLSLYQAATLYKQAGKQAHAIRLFQDYAWLYPNPYDPALNARSTVADYYKSIGDSKNELIWLAHIVRGHDTQKQPVTARSVSLASNAQLKLASADKTEFERVKLTLPLQKSLGKKKNALKKAVASYEKVASYGVPEHVSEVTFSLADLYYRLARDVLDSSRPVNLDELQLEQYEILLEEQAYPFEEKAISLHELNTENTLKGIYDKWVRESYRFLATMVPARYKRELQGIRSSHALY